MGMPKTYKITQENTTEIRKAMSKEKRAGLYRRMEAVALRGEGKSNAEVAKLTKFHPKYVSQLVSLYCRKGIEALATEGRKGGNHRNLSIEQEREILKDFKESAASGHIITPAEIKAKYDETLGRETKPTFIYSVLKRNGWRMVMPRSRHPKKSSDEVIEASKKLTRNFKN